jgi:hypothetical protein
LIDCLVGNAVFLREVPRRTPGFPMNERGPAPTPSTRHRVIVASVPFMIAVPALIAAVMLWRSPLPKQGTAGLFGMVGAILIVDLATCGFVLVQWLWTGEPPELSLSPLVLTREERQFRHNLRTRPKLDDEQFYDAYYADSGIARTVPAELRKLLGDVLGLDLGALSPTDKLVDDELDWADVFFRMERVFKVPIPREKWKVFDGSFDSLLTLLTAGPIAGLPRAIDER